MLQSIERRIKSHRIPFEQMKFKKLEEKSKAPIFISYKPFILRHIFEHLLFVQIDSVLDSDSWNVSGKMRIVSARGRLLD